MATSLNGIICLEDGSEPFLSVAGGELIADFARKTGSLIWGRRTYEDVQRRYDGTQEMDLNQLLNGLPKVVVSSDPNFKVIEDYEVARSPQAAIALLSAKKCKETTVVGGSKLNAAFLDAGLVNEIVVDIEPVLVGRGLPLFAPSDTIIDLELLSIEPVNEGEVFLRYKVANRNNE